MEARIAILDPHRNGKTRRSVLRIGRYVRFGCARLLGMGTRPLEIGIWFMFRVTTLG